MAPSSQIVNPTTKHTHTVIFLHGRGSNASEFQSEIFESQDSSGQFFTQLFPSVKWIFPCAELRWSQTEQEDIHQWFDMTSVQNAHEHSEIQRPGLEESREQLLGIIDEEEKCVPRERIIVAGISQGCAAALWTLLSTGIRVGGFLGLSGWLPLAGDMFKERSSSQGLRGTQRIPILLQHCEDDGVVPIADGEAMRVCLEEMMMDVKWQHFEEGGHWLNEPGGVDGIAMFLRRIMAI